MGDERTGLATRAAVAGALLERDAELARLEALAEAAREGHGRLAVVEGAAGIGKTRLVSEAAGACARAGMRVLAARGGELERDFPYGVVRQLFEPLLRRARSAGRRSLLAGAAALAAPLLEEPGGRRAEDQPPADVAVVLHALYWLTSNLAEQAPLVLTIDDAQWSDDPSLRYVEYMTRRLADVPVLIVVGVRSGQRDSDSGPLQRAGVDPVAERFQLTPLSERASAALVRAELSGDADEDLCRACHRASCGNPFLLNELLIALRQSDLTAGVRDPAGVARLAPEGIKRTILLRLSQLPEDASRLARAVAVLGDGAPLDDAAALAELSALAASAAADELCAAEILQPARPLEFVHPVVREAIYADSLPGRRAQAHARAARQLHDGGAPPERIAAQLLASDPGGQQWAVAALREAAREALARGAPATAATYLGRALGEPPDERVRVELVGELGTAEALAGVPAAAEHLGEAFDAAEGGASRARAARALAQALVPVGRIHEAVTALETAGAEVADCDRELTLALGADIAALDNLAGAIPPASAARLDRLGRGLRGDTPAERLLLGTLSYRRAKREATADEAAGAAERALAAGDLAPESMPFVCAVFTLLYAERFAAAERWLSRALEQASERGSAFTFGAVSWQLAQSAHRQGSLASAEAHVRTPLELAREHGWTAAVPSATAVLLDVLVARGELAAAARVEASAPHEDLREVVSFASLRESRGRLLVAQGETRAGIESLLEAGRRYRAWGVENPAISSWRSDAAAALAALGEHSQARRLADEELALARAWGTPRAIGVALRSLAHAERGEAGVELLREAVAVLEPSQARLEHARALVDLGAALRRAGCRADAREPLRRGIELAQACGAAALERHARDELASSGGRPRRIREAAAPTLTPSERRIAELAAQGLSNRDIAQTLFLSLKTVEMHLSHSYRKLDIGSRNELEGALGTVTRSR